jgi:hypothetical protein
MVLKFESLFIFTIEPNSSLLSGRMYNSVDLVKCMMLKNVSQPDIDAVFANSLFKYQKNPSLSKFRPLTGWGLHQFV